MRLDARFEAIEEALPIFKATLGHEDLIRELAVQRDHPVHALLRRLAEEVAGSAPAAATASEKSTTTDQELQAMIGGRNR